MTADTFDAFKTEKKMNNLTSFMCFYHTGSFITLRAKQPLLVGGTFIFPTSPSHPNSLLGASLSFPDGPNGGRENVVPVK